MKMNKRRGIVTFLSIIAWSLVLALAFAVNVGGDADRAAEKALRGGTRSAFSFCKS